MNEVIGDILEVQSGTIIHQVNCLGVWGAGLARQLLEKYPEAYRDYTAFLNRQRHSVLCLGRMLIADTENPKVSIGCLFGQYDFGRGAHRFVERKTEYSAIISCMSLLKRWQETDLRLRDIHIPYGMGCGLGGGDWDIVFNIIKKSGVENTTIHRLP